MPLKSHRRRPDPAGAAQRPWWAATSTRPVLAVGSVKTRTLASRVFSALISAALLVGLGVVLTANQVKDVTVEDGLIAHKQTLNALLGGCGPEYAWEHPDAAVLVPRLAAGGAVNRVIYPNIVPMAGPFWDAPVPDGKSVWTRQDTQIPVPENLLYNQWRGQMVVYYTRDVPADDVRRLADLARNNPDLGLLVVPWTYSRPMPEGRTIAFATWNASQSCHVLALPAIWDFRAHHPAKASPGQTGQPSPGPGQLAADGVAVKP